MEKGRNDGKNKQVCGGMKRVCVNVEAKVVREGRAGIKNEGS